MKQAITTAYTAIVAKALPIGVTIFLVGLVVVPSAMIASLDETTVGDVLGDTTIAQEQSVQTEEVVAPIEEPSVPETTQEEPTPIVNALIDGCRPDIDGDNCEPPEPPVCVSDVASDIRAADGSALSPNNSRISIGGGAASISFKNFSEGCTYQLRIASYKMFALSGADWIKTQTLFDDTVVLIAPGVTKTISVPVPTCAYQVDFFNGPSTPTSNPDFANLSGFTVFDYKINPQNLTVCGSTPPPPSEPTPPACPFTSADGTVVAFSTQNDPQWILSKTDPTKNSITKSVSLTAGTYTVKTFGWDGYSDRVNVSQAHEQWNVKALTSGDATLGTVGPTTDLADNVVQASRTNTFTNGLVIAQNAAKVSAVHAFPNDTSSPNSIVPVCAAFKKVDVVEPPTIPACPFTSADGTVVVFSTQNDQKFLLTTDSTKHRFTKSLALVAGTYTVKTFSWDGSTIRHNQTQPHEQWNVEIRNGSNVVLDTAGATNDLADMVSEASATNVFTDAIVIAQSGASISVAHAFPNDTATPNSVSPVCVALKKKEVTAKPTLTLIKNVINDDGGTKVDTDFPLFINGTPAVTGVAKELDAGSYTASETNLPGYTAGQWGGDCNAQGQVTLSAGQNKVCTITNNDNPEQPNPAYLKVFKNVINDDGGTSTVSAFKLYVNNQQVQHDVSNQFAPGNYTVHEDNIPGYTAGVWGGDCAANGTVTLQAGDNKTCTITNNDNPNVPTKGTLTLIKNVVNNDGGTKVATDFPLFVNATQVQHNIPAQFNPGTYTASETNQAGYTAGQWGGDCNANGTVTLLAGDNKVCTITNDDNPIVTATSSLTLIKNVVNNDGGTKTVSDFKLYINDALATSGVEYQIPAGTYTASEDNLAGYTPGAWGGDCAPNGSVTLAAGQHKTCTITNDDNPPAPVCSMFLNPTTIEKGATSTLSWTSQHVTSATINQGIGSVPVNGSTQVSPIATTTYIGTFSGQYGTVTCTTTLAVSEPPIGGFAELRLIKTVINNDGGDREVSDFKLYVNNTQVQSGAYNQFAPGSYTVHEDSFSDYDASDWGGDCSGNGSVTLAAGDKKTCTITNDDEDGGGGGGGGGGSSRRRPNVTLFSNPEILGASVSLAQVPYTGLGSSIFQIILFVVGLVAISGGVVYIFVRRRLGDATFSVHMAHAQRPQQHVHEQPLARIIHEETVASAPVADDAFASYEEYLDIESADAYRTPVARQEVSVPNNLPVEPVSVASVVAHAPAVRMATQRHEERAAVVSVARLQNAARASQVIISEDGIKLITASVEGDEGKSLERLSQVIEAAKTRYPREDGWLILDRERVRESLFISILSMVPLFIEWIVRGEDKHVFAFMRMLKLQNQPVADFIRKVVAELDNAHRARLEGASDIAVDPHVAEVTYHLHNHDLETMVTELLSGVDERYDSAYTSVRLALVRVLDVVKSRQMTRVGGTYAFEQESAEA